MKCFKLGENRLTTQVLVKLAKSSDPDVALSAGVKDRLKKDRDIIDNSIKSGQTFYGINTGFGYLSNVRIDSEELKRLQVNLIRSHACGVGASSPDHIVRSLLLLRAHTFCLGATGISLNCLNLILDFLRHDILPIIPMQGSVGASGDLAPLSHLALGLIGEGDVSYKGGVEPAKKVCNSLRIKPLIPSPKEGLSLINGTHFMSVLGAFALEQAKYLVQSADVIAALSLEATRGTPSSFDKRIHEIRPQVGQRAVANNLRALYKDQSSIMESHKDCDKVQDPYSFRCIPQVHGASHDVLAFVEEKLNIELNSVTDNPLCFEDGSIISGGNFHGQPIAMSMDFLGIALAEIASISERRLEKMTNPTMSGLPAFIIKEGGLNSGFMIPHVVSAALVSENKSLSHPASVDSIPTSADKEDHVSMGPIAARKTQMIVENTANVLAIELLAACQGVDLLKPLTVNPVLQEVCDKVREISPHVESDRSLYKDIEKVKNWILEGGIVNTVTAMGIKLCTTTQKTELSVFSMD